MKKHHNAVFETLQKSTSKQEYESPYVKVTAFGKEDVVCSSGGTYVQETFSGGDTYGYDFWSWN